MYFNEVCGNCKNGNSDKQPDIIFPSIYTIKEFSGIYSGKFFKIFNKMGLVIKQVLIRKLCKVSGIFVCDQHIAETLDFSEF